MLILQCALSRWKIVDWNAAIFQAKKGFTDLLYHLTGLSKDGNLLDYRCLENRLRFSVRG